MDIWVDLLSRRVGWSELVRIERPKNSSMQTQQYGRCRRADQFLQFRGNRIFTAAKRCDNVQAAGKIAVEPSTNGVGPGNYTVCGRMLLVAHEPPTGEDEEGLLFLFQYFMLNYFRAEFHALAQDGPEIRG